MKFVSNRVAFGRHQTFAVRYGWLSKGFQAVVADKAILKSESAVAKLGVGKNMVESIGYWLRAFQLVDPNTLEATEIGKAIFRKNSGRDPYLEDEATIWLLHWLLISNPEQATAWYWFFNRYHKPEFTGQEIQTGLTDFVNDQVKDIKRPATSTIKADATLIPRMYTQSKLHKHMPIEEALDSPLALLRLVTPMVGERGFQSKQAARRGLPIGILGFAIVQLFSEKEVDVIPIEDLMYSRDHYPAPGAVFRLSEVALLAKLEKLTEYIPGVFQINETAGIHQLYRLRDIDPMDFLYKHYSLAEQGVAA